MADHKRVYSRLKIRNPHKRLFSLWGVIDCRHNQLIASKLSGNKILDAGCGYGSLVNFLSQKGYEAEGIDFDKASVDIAKRLFPNVKIKPADIERLNEYADCSFDTIVLKDCLHHLAGDGDVRGSFKNFRRILKNNGRIVILDPNPIWIVRLARKLAFHKDPKAELKFTLNLLDKEGFLVKGLEFYETIGIPLSGGYVGIRLVPNTPLLNRIIAGANSVISHLVNQLGIGKYLCWRYLVYADKKNSISIDKSGPQAL